MRPGSSGFRGRGGTQRNSRGETTCVEASRAVDRISVITEGVVGVALEAVVNRDL